MKPPKDFVLGAIYLISGIYSLGFSLVMAGAAEPLSGRVAYVPVPDGLFGFEVAAFTTFGLIFVIASVYHFLATYRSFSKEAILVNTRP